MTGTAAQFITIAMFILILYTYAGYPLLLALLSVLKRRKIKDIGANFSETPNVSFIITAYNEERAIREKILATLELDYPEEKIEIIVASDGSTDRTEEITHSFSFRKVKLISVSGRKGKTEAQNAAVLQAAGDILVFSDATSVYEKDAIRELVRVFNDPEVGCVGGQLKYRADGDSASSKGGKTYWKYERWIKENESEIDSLIGVSGAIYAVRKSIYTPIPPDQISDFVIALQTVEYGYRVAYASRAICTETTLRKAGNEFGMRVRVALRSFRALWYKRAIFNPFRYGFYSIQLISHKFFRYLIPQMLIVLVLFNALLLDNVVYRYFFGLQIGFYSLAITGRILDSKGYSLRPASMAYYFCLINIASLLAFLKFMAGEKVITWEPVRQGQREHEKISAND
jgi:cellulose synthase/poly-beta-1,6-N-acetylglucosamine synthase-like glycosyltransferase